MSGRSLGEGEGKGMERDITALESWNSDEAWKGDLVRPVLRRFISMLDGKSLGLIEVSARKDRHLAKWVLMKALGLVESWDLWHTVSLRIEAPVSENSSGLASFDAARLSIVAILPDEKAAIEMAVNCPGYFLRDEGITFTKDFLREPIRLNVPMTDAIEIARDCVNTMGVWEGPDYGPRANGAGHPGRCALAAT